MKVAFIGLGAMGYPMAGHLSIKDFNVTVYNRSIEKASEWTNFYSGIAQLTPKNAAKEADVVLLCVGNDDDVRSVVYGNLGVLAGMREGSVLIDHTTCSADLAIELSKACAEKGVDFLDAPVSGGEAGAKNGQLSVMVGGDQTVYDKVTAVFDAYSKKHALIGPVGSGQRAKMVNQICIAGIVQGLSEALHFAQNADLDMDQVLQVISKGAAQSWQMENRAKTMLENQFDFGFAVDWMIKDLDIVLNEAQKNNSTLPLTSLVKSFYEQVSANGGGRFDTSSLITLLNK